MTIGRLLILSGRWLISCLLFFSGGCKEQKVAAPDDASIKRHYLQIDSVRPLLRSGDIIFRNGTDEVSRAARSMNRIDTSFSHCGILMIENDSAMVYNAIGGIYNPDQKLRRELLDSFLLPREADRFAVYRYHLDGKQADSLQKIVRAYYAAGLPFDMFFNVQTDDKMYCSEFVFKALNRSLNGALGRIVQAREWPFGISPDDLYLNDMATLIKRVDFIP
jgi:hypothetical protein